MTLGMNLMLLQASPS